VDGQTQMWREEGREGGSEGKDTQGHVCAEGKGKGGREGGNVSQRELSSSLSSSSSSFWGQLLLLETVSIQTDDTSLPPSLPPSLPASRCVRIGLSFKSQFSIQPFTI